MSNYTALYEGNDIGDVAIDILVSVGAFLVGFGAPIGLVILYRWMVGGNVRLPGT